MEGGRERARVLLSGEEKKGVDLGLGAPSLVSSLIFLRTRSLTYMSLEVHIVSICGHSGMKNNKIMLCASYLLEASMGPGFSPSSTSFCLSSSQEHFSYSSSYFLLSRPEDFRFPLGGMAGC